MAERHLCPRPHLRQYDQLSNAIMKTLQKMGDLARRGRRGQWILHQQDLYVPYLDTRPQSRNPDTDVPVRGLTFHGALVDDWDFRWAGSGPAPDFQDISFWKDTIRELEDKIEQVQARRVQPKFTPEELQTLAALEQEHGHVFCREHNRKTRRLRVYKDNVIAILFHLASYGRAGQWVLHNEDFYHPLIDTRPQTRTPGKSIVVRDEHYTGKIVAADGLSICYELRWDGKDGSGAPPDLDDFAFWEETAMDLRGKLYDVRHGAGAQPQFTPDELRTLEALEQDPEHAFAVYLQYQKEALLPAVSKTTTEEEEVAAIQLARAKLFLMSVVHNLWDAGLPGQWVLHREPFYLPQYDTAFRERYQDEDGCAEDDQENVLADESSGLRYDTRFGPPPDLSDIAVWQAKEAELKQKLRDVNAGRLTEHHFTEGELVRIKLLQRAASEAREHVGDATTRQEQAIASWLDGSSETVPLPPPSVNTNRKRPADNDNTSRPAKYRRPQPPRETRATRAMGRQRQQSDSSAGPRPIKSARIAALPPRQYRC